MRNAIDTAEWTNRKRGTWRENMKSKQKQAKSKWTNRIEKAKNSELTEMFKWRLCSSNQIRVQRIGQHKNITWNLPKSTKEFKSKENAKLVYAGKEEWHNEIKPCGLATPKDLAALVALVENNCWLSKTQKYQHEHLPAGPSMKPVGKALPSSVIVRPRSPLSPLSPFEDDGASINCSQVRRQKTREDTFDRQK